MHGNAYLPEACAIAAAWEHAGVLHVIIGLGVDLIATRRIERELAQGKWTPGSGIFTAGELFRCYSARKPMVWMAACIAAKMAALKALGIAVATPGLFRDVEVEFRDGYEQVVFHRRLKARSREFGVKHVKVALAPKPRQAGAVVVLES